ncbi:flagellar protein FlaG [Aeromonas allosaccharophila]|uniref:flagellar protein FlaG n=1 Tax=Aeromonas allosaccharophila TaxID=656 RepID=UPI0030055568
MPSEMTIGVSTSLPVVANREPGNEVTRLAPLTAQSKSALSEKESISAKEDAKARQNEQEREDRAKSLSVAEEVAKMQELAVLKGWSVNFRIDDDSGKTVIKLLDRDSQEVIRQIPSDELLAIARRLKALAEDNDAGVGILIDSHI